MSQDTGSSNEILSRIKQLELEVAKQSQEIKQLKEEVEGPIALVRPIDGTWVSSSVAQAVDRTVPAVASGSNITVAPAAVVPRHTDSVSTYRPSTVTSPLSSGSSSATRVNTAAAVLRLTQLSESLIKSIKDNDSIDIIRKLISEGADLAYKDYEKGLSALANAVFFGNIEFVVLLIDSGSPLESRSDIGRTPLHIGAEKGYLRIVQLLLGAGAYVNAIDNKGCTPLMIAAGFGQIQCVRALIDGGANIFLKDKKGRTAKDKARDEKIQDMFS